jgi:hypothetical protein
MIVHKPCLIILPTDCMNSNAAACCAGQAASLFRCKTPLAVAQLPAAKTVQLKHKTHTGWVMLYIRTPT